MARTISEIKKGLTTEFMSNSVLASAYGFTPGDDFDAKFSKVSVENLLFYLFSAAAYLLECLFDAHKSDVNEIVEDMIPGTPKWYRDKALSFLKGQPLVDDTDEYDTSNMSEADITKAKIIKYAAAIEESGSSLLIIKIATGEVGSLAPIADTDTNPELTQFTAYIQQIKYAGVRFSVINQVGDAFASKIVVYYNPILSESDVLTAVKTSIQGYIQGLPFNGEYSNMALIDAVQAVDGVKIADFKSASSGTPLVGIAEKVVPAAGYFTYNEDNLNIEMRAYEG